ncbi:hypothetical protein Hdeb2414_s0008g00292311 [Helianthus debilis subsp. tardiflorus]
MLITRFYASCPAAGGLKTSLIKFSTILRFILCNFTIIIYKIQALTVNLNSKIPYITSNLIKFSTNLLT